MEGRSLTLAGELLLLSVDPARGGLLADRRRLAQALVAAGGSRSAAQAELIEAGLIRRGGGLRRPLQLVDRAAAGERFRALHDKIRNDALDDRRDQELFLLLAWTGVLARRLPRNERRTAASRLRGLGSVLVGEPAGTEPQVGSARSGVSPVIMALGIAGIVGGVAVIDGDSLLEGSGLTGTAGDTGGGGDGGGGGGAEFGGGDFGGGGSP